MKLTREEAIDIILNNTYDEGLHNCMIPINWPDWKEEYPMIIWQKKLMTVARFVCGAKGKMVSRHLCHNKSCINPAHIVPGTAEENWMDNMYKPFKMPVHYRWMGIKKPEEVLQLV